jgi:CHAD domain-containing protein
MSEAADAPEAADVAVDPAFPLLAHLDGLMGDLRGRVPVALNEWDAESIHQSRVATRRMKAALDLMKAVLGKRNRRRLGRVLKNLRRRLGPLRDGDVMLEHLQEFGRDGKHGRAVAWMSERLLRERDRLRQRSAKGKPAADVLAKLASWGPVREEVLATREAADSLLAESLHLQLDAFAEQADRLTASKPADSSEELERQDPHELRISGKALRYTLEMAVAQGHDLPGSLTKTFKKMQDALGLWHDYVVLADHAMQAALDEQLSNHEPELMNDVFELLRDVLREATDDLDKFKRLWSAEGDAIARSIRTTFPLTRAKVSGPGTGPGPSGSGSPEAAEEAPPAESSNA